MLISEPELQACPVCGGTIIEDAYEDLQKQADGHFVMDAYPAYVCENDCGYVKRIHDVPNLFQFATSELSQDAFLCWLFEHVRLRHESVAQRVASDLLEKILVAYKTFNPDIVSEKMIDYELVAVEQQLDHIDILLTLESIYDEKMYIVIEDKIDSGESRKNQPEYYSKKLKDKDPEATIIPVLLKTGYVTAEQRKNYEKRKVVFIGYQDIYDLFIPYLPRLKEQVILQTWWQNFYENHYRPIEAAKALAIDPQSTLRQFTRLCNVQGFPDRLAFQIITDYLFGDIEELPSKRHRVQGKGHSDWHFEIQNPRWKNKANKIRLNLNFIWDLQKFSFVIKTTPIPYKPKNRLAETDKNTYTTFQAFIKAEIRNMKLDAWKITNHYLTIAKMPYIEDMSLGTLKQTLADDIEQLSKKFDEIMRE